MKGEREVGSNPFSNLSFLKSEFSDIIQSEKCYDTSGRGSTRYCQRYTFVFIDGSYLSIVEHLNENGNLDYFCYDYYDKNKQIISKFHSEPHGDKKYQTRTEPYHIHTYDMLGNEKRIENHTFHDLYSVLEHLRLRILENRRLI